MGQRLAAKPRAAPGKESESAGHSLTVCGEGGWRALPPLSVWHDWRLLGVVEPLVARIQDVDTQTSAKAATMPRCRDARRHWRGAAMGIPCFACTPDLFPDLMAAAIQRHSLEQWTPQADIVRA
jgi:hypothetical protein